MRKGLIIVFTGDGKGKTTAALGIALRACGHKMRVSMIQFVKAVTESGEEQIAERLKPEFELLTMGRGFVNHPGDKAPFEEHKEAADAALGFARQRIQSGYWDIVVLDEINIAVQHGLLDIESVMSMLRRKPSKVHVILTGRDAHPALIEMADLVTDMRLVKHPYDMHSLPAQQGIDY
jgi:cob(I)alamin adenosyltransferase